MCTTIPARSRTSTYATRTSAMVFPKIFTHFAQKNLFPKVKAQEEEEQEEEEEDIVDPQETLRNECREEDHVKTLLDKYEECNSRVRSRSKTLETCTEELFDFMHALDHCVTKTLFSKLK